jgi:hypothetical protein
MTSTIKVNNVQNQCGQNIINENSNTITLGASGDTIALASGASQTGFGRTGTVDWQTGSIKTTTFTAANGEGYFANTSGGTFTMNLPAGTAGNIVSVVDYTNTFQTNKLTIAPNGSQKIGGVQASTELTTQGQSVTFVYVDDTEGWKNVQDSTSNVTGAVAFMAATVSGACNTLVTAPDCANTKIATFVGPGTFCVSQIAIGPTAPANNIVSYVVVAGGGGGGRNSAGGGGAGGFREGKSPGTPYTASPLNAPTGLEITSAGGIPVTVGGGGPAPANPPDNGGQGSNSIFSTITSAGGGHGGGRGLAGNPGGSGGGFGSDSGHHDESGTGNDPVVTPPQGQPGGAPISPGPNPVPSGVCAGAGGGGAGAAGSGWPGTRGQGGAGGNGVATQINPAKGNPSTNFSGGGGGSGAAIGPNNQASGGSGGGGQAGNSSNNGTAGVANTGGGGGGAGPGAPSGGAGGGSGIVIIRYKFQ